MRRTTVSRTFGVTWRLETDDLLFLQPPGAADLARKALLRQAQREDDKTDCSGGPVSARGRNSGRRLVIDKSIQRLKANNLHEHLRLLTPMTLWAILVIICISVSWT